MSTQHAALAGTRDPAAHDGPALTRRETEVLSLIAHGHTNVESAQLLRISVRTVETHRAHIHRKLGLTTRAELVRHALSRGLLALPAEPASQHAA